MDTCDIWLAIINRTTCCSCCVSGNALIEQEIRYVNSKWSPEERSRYSSKAGFSSRININRIAYLDGRILGWIM